MEIIRGVFNIAFPLRLKHFEGEQIKTSEGMYGSGGARGVGGGGGGKIRGSYWFWCRLLVFLNETG